MVPPGMEHVQTCSKCSRANPPQAIYCFFDGFVLSGHERRAGPLAVGAQPFASPFVFPTGRSCRNFDELALACQEEWTTACNLLKDGYLESFFGGLGRMDLALAAKEAASFPDLERGLDGLLAKLPTGVLEEPKLRAEPADVNLGLIETDRERTFDLELENQGMRLLYGTVSSNAVWLTLGESPGSSEKHFHFTHETRLAVHVRADRIPAGNKPVQAKLLIESNGGTCFVTVRAEKPIKPFPPGPLGGAKKPRQIAEKAQANPKEVAPLFESGEVGNWYAANGWTYPVKIPAASGIAAIQQFFEALGVTKAPKVQISHTELSLQGDPGASLDPVTIAVSSEEKRPVFAHATSNVSWLEVGRAKLNGRLATISVSIPVVPDRPGELLEADLEVVSNGNQRFCIPVTLQISGVKPPEPPTLSVEDEPENAFDFTSAPSPPPPPVPPTPPPVLPPIPPPVVQGAAPTRPALPVPPTRPAVPTVSEGTFRPSKGGDVPVPGRPSSPELPERKSVVRRRSRGPRGLPLHYHAAPAVLLLLAVLGVALFDYFGPKIENLDKPLANIPGPRYDTSQLQDSRPRIEVAYSHDYRFGVVLVDPTDPDNKGKWKHLTGGEDGPTNNTVIKIDNSEYRFGKETPSNHMLYRLRPLPAPYIGRSSTMDFKEEGVRVTQYIQLIPGQDGYLDTILVWYTATNIGTRARKVGIRILLDTRIGNNDRVPFTVPGTKGFVKDKAEYTTRNIPDYLEVVENPNDSRNPGTITRIGLRGIEWSDIELLEPERVRIGHFPGQYMGWDWPLEPLGDDSCVAVYWPEKELQPNGKMNLAMTYGLGKLDITDQLALSVPSSVLPKREFIITAYVYGATKGQKVTLELPAGMELIEGEAVQVVEEAADRAQVFWKVKAKREGSFRIEVTSGRAKARPVTIEAQTRGVIG